MSIVQLGLLFTISTSFGLALWVAFPHRKLTPATDGAMPDERAEFAAFGPTRVRFKAETLDLELEVRAAADAAVGLACEHFVRIHLAVGSGTTVRMDPIAMRTALRTVMRTAIRATPGGQVLVTGSAIGTQMHIRIVDDGTDADQGSRESLAREPEALIALQGGSIAVEARRGRGTTVIIRLPLPGKGTDEMNDLIEESALADQAA